MKVRKIYTTEGREFVTNDLSEELLAKLEGIERTEIIEMEPDEFWQIPATSESQKFFSGVENANR
jgi:hypothetical protein